MLSAFLFHVSCWSRFTSLATASPQLQGWITQPLGEYSGIQIQCSAVLQKYKGMTEDKVQHTWCGLWATGSAEPGTRGTSKVAAEVQSKREAFGKKQIVERIGKLQCLCPISAATYLSGLSSELS